MRTFGENLKNIRESLGFSQYQLAKLMKVAPQRVSEWETGKIEPSLRPLIKLTKILDVPFEELIDGIQVE